MQYNKIEKLLNDKGMVLKHYKSVKSTMQTIKNLIKKNSSCFFVVADKQTQGIGRRGNKWHSPQGNIYLSLNLKTFNDIKDHYIFGLMTALSISETLDDLCKVSSKIKWPNDIYINGKKISGLITEIFKDNNSNFMIIGVGINFISSPKISNYPTTYIKQINKNLEKITIIKLFIKNILNNYEKIINFDYDYIKKKFKKKLLFLNKEIEIEISNDLRLKGIFTDINFDGSMRINVNGVSKNIYSGRILNDIN